MEVVDICAAVKVADIAEVENLSTVEAVLIAIKPGLEQKIVNILVRQDKPKNAHFAEMVGNDVVKNGVVVLERSCREVGRPSHQIYCITYPGSYVIIGVPTYPMCRI